MILLFHAIFNNGPFSLRPPPKKKKTYFPENQHATGKGTISKGTFIFQPSIFRGHVSFREGNPPQSMDYSGSGDRWAWDYITAKRRQELYLVYKWYIYSQLEEYMLPTTFYKKNTYSQTKKIPTSPPGHGTISPYPWHERCRVNVSNPSGTLLPRWHRLRRLIDHDRKQRSSSAQQRHTAPRPKRGTTLINRTGYEVPLL